jgi:quercetin dioxygenase-like cupin family protein
MNSRRQFLQAASFGAVAGPALTTIAIAQEAPRQEPVKEMPNATPMVVGPGDGTRVWAMGVHVTIKVRSKDTNGAYSIFEDIIPPGAGPVPHTHTKEDETIFVIEGQLRAWLGGQQYDLKVGDFVHMPRGVEHYFKNVGDTHTRMLLSYTPGGFEQWFIDIGKPVGLDPKVSPPITNADIAEAVEAAKRYGVQFEKPS